MLANGYFVNRHSRLAKKFDFTFESTADLNRRSIDDVFFCRTTLYNQNCLFGHHAGPINTELVQVLNVHYYHFTIYVHDYNG